jgi:hypothetical protein
MFDNRSKYGQNAGPQWIKIPISYQFVEEIVKAEPPEGYGFQDLILRAVESEVFIAK